MPMNLNPHPIAWLSRLLAVVLPLASTAAGADLALRTDVPMIRPGPRVAARVPDKLRPPPPGDVRITGLIGARLDANRRGILMHKDEDALLLPFRQRGSRQGAWNGEHVGKWISAASLTCGYSGDQELLAKIQRVAKGLIATQLPDGYLGTYVDADRWTSWDVWIHKYNLLGLIDYYEATGDEQALDACRRMADLLQNTFGPGKRDILKAGEHMGMAATSVLEPIVRLYRHTARPQDLAFAEYIIDAIEQPHGPHIISDLLREKQVDKTANGKAYEMVSNLIGMLELYRVNGDKRLLDACVIACDDIMKRQLYITGGSTFEEHFVGPDMRPNAGCVAEACVTMSLLQLYGALQETTGDPEYALQAESLIYNHLLAGQQLDGEKVCYYTPLWGHKIFFDFLGCCISSLPRAIAMIPSMAYLCGDDYVVVNLLGDSELDTTLASGSQVKIVQRGGGPYSAEMHLNMTHAGNRPIMVGLRSTSWVGWMGAETRLEEKLTGPVPGDYKWYVIPPGGAASKPAAGEILAHFDLNWWSVSKSKREGFFTLLHGPLTYCFDLAANAHIPRVMDAVFDADPKALDPMLITSGVNGRVEVNGWVPDEDGKPIKKRLTLLPYLDAGQTDYFSVWLRERDGAADRPWSLPVSLFTDVYQAASRKGTSSGSIVDNNISSYASTDNGQRSDEEWFEVNARWHCKYNLIVFHQGPTGDNSHGGWFDTSKGKPRVQFKTWGDYEDVGVLEDYPDTTAEDPGTLQPHQAIRFVISRDKRKMDFRVRIIGAPSCGKHPEQNQVSCSELQVFYDPELEK